MRLRQGLRYTAPACPVLKCWVCVRALQGGGELIEKVINLAGNPVDDPLTGSNPHYGDTAVDGTFVTSTGPLNVWTYHSLCSAHLEEAMQWGENIGLEDSIFLTVEEWTNLDGAKVASNGFVGLTAHAVDMASKTAYAVGAFGAGGYEKIVEINCGTPGYVCFALSGYNGAFGSGGKDPFVERKKAVQPTRADGSDWVFPQNIVPARVYVGVKVRGHSSSMRKHAWCGGTLRSCSHAVMMF